VGLEATALQAKNIREVTRFVPAPPMVKAVIGEDDVLLMGEFLNPTQLRREKTNKMEF
jgi:hypothetical protein